MLRGAAVGCNQHIPVVEGASQLAPLLGPRPVVADLFNQKVEVRVIRGGNSSPQIGLRLRLRLVQRDGRIQELAGIWHLLIPIGIFQLFLLRNTPEVNVSVQSVFVGSGFIHQRKGETRHKVPKAARHGSFIPEQDTKEDRWEARVVLSKRATDMNNL